MDLLRLETLDCGPVYVKAETVLILGRKGDNTTCVVHIGGERVMDLLLAGDIDEVAAAFESSYHACRIYRVT